MKGLRTAVRQVAERSLRRDALQILAAETPQQMSLERLRDTIELAGLGKPALEHVEAAVAWLERQSLVARVEIAGGAGAFDLAKLTRRGLDAAEGRLQLPGIAPARPPGDG